ncbi:MAG: hypothetical protein OQL18_03965, partial [Deltaproteobacteria bacterium]|nr:hypothetical protein [Deltaproteobacteria bacterium]
KINRSKIIAGQVGLNEYGISVLGPKSNSVGKTSHILLPSSAIGFPHWLQLTLQGKMRLFKPYSLL